MKALSVLFVLGVFGSAYAMPPKAVNLSQWPVIIDQSGHYVLTRDWDVGGASQDLAPVIKITADSVTLDLRGFSIASNHDAPTIQIEGTHVALRNGTVKNFGMGYAIASTAESTLVDSMAVQASTPLVLRGETSVVSKTSVVGQIGVVLEGTGSRLEWSDVACSHYCVVAHDRTEVHNNRITGQGQGDPLIHVQGSAVLIANNLLSGGPYAGDSTIIAVEGNRNVIRGNTLRGGEDVENLIALCLLGSANVADGNIAEPHGSTRWREGVRFGADGNFYGDNRMAAIVPFNIGGTVQTDWGGNVGY